MGYNICDDCIKNSTDKCKCLPIDNICSNFELELKQFNWLKGGVYLRTGLIIACVVSLESDLHRHMEDLILMDSDGIFKNYIERCFSDLKSATEWIVSTMNAGKIEYERRKRLRKELSNLEFIIKLNKD